MRTITIHHKNIFKANRSKIKIAVAVSLTILTIFSCRSTDAEGPLTPSGQTALSISVKDAAFESTADIANKASTAKSTIAAPLVQQNTVAFGDDFYLLAELTQEVGASSSSVAKASSSQPSKAATETTNIGTNIRYKIVVYDQNGIYVTEKDYTRGSEATTGPLMLDGSKTYTFIIYSVNSTSTIPAITFADTANKTLATSSVNIAGNVNFMYYRKDMTLSGSANNYLEVVLQHKLSQITTTIDATQTGYNITAISSNINTHSPNASIALANGTITRSGTITTSPVSFATLGGLTATSTPTIVNAATNGTTSYNLTSITVGPLTQTGIVAFTNLTITPGVKYNMKLNIVPTDAFITHQGLPAIRLNGLIWMRHNLRKDGNYNPDPDQLVAATNGDYFQWGRLANILAGGLSVNTLSVGDWDTNINRNANSWNATPGTLTNREDNPTKSSNDPCPNNYRVPTNKELESLINNTVATSVGTGTKNNSNYSYGLILTSKRKSTVKMTIPTQGSLFASVPPDNYTASFNGFASVSRIWSSYYNNTSNTNAGVITSHLNANNTVNPFTASATIRNAEASNSGTLSLPIRCIAE
jgi:uncharacterized protein (TIGR02145 family)